MIVIADTIPINYLVLIGEQELLPALFGQVIIPEAVFRELLATETPQVVRQWLSNRPQWLETRKATMAPDTSLSHLDDGEREAIQLAEELGADLLLVDEKAARREAARRRLAMINRAYDDGRLVNIGSLRQGFPSWKLCKGREQLFAGSEGLSRKDLVKSQQRTWIVDLDRLQRAGPEANLLHSYYVGDQ